ncbi:MAG: hypothetical protein U1F43_28850 [Myxococcota bacterium]
MTNPHQIGELLRAGVRPTEEETEHLRAVGGFVATMHGRYLDGRRPQAIDAGSDAWSSRLSNRLAASTAERWQQGLGLSEMLLAGDLGRWWDLSRGGFSRGYEGFDPEMEVLALFEDEVAPVATETEQAEAPRRRGSLFGAKSASARGRLAPTRLAKAGSGSKPMRRPMVASRDEASAAGSAAPERRVAARWTDGAFAELTVLRALASGGLHVADQVVDIIEEMGAAGPGPVGHAVAGAATLPTPAGWMRRPGAGAAPSRPDAMVRTGRESVRHVPRVSLDGMVIDERTPALAAALGRADAVFGGLGATTPALNSARLEGLTSATKVSIDRGLGVGARPVYGFYDAVESTFLSLASEMTAASASEAAAAPAVVPSGARELGRSVRRLPAIAQRLAGTQGPARVLPPAGPRDAAVRGEVSPAAARVPARQQVTTSLERVVRTQSGGRDVRPFTAGVFSSAPHAAPRTLSRLAVEPDASRTSSTDVAGRTIGAGAESPNLRADGRSSGPPSIEMAMGGGSRRFDIASRVAFTPEGRPVAAVERGSMSAPRMAISSFDFVRGGVAASQQASSTDSLVPAARSASSEALGARAAQAVGSMPTRGGDARVRETMGVEAARGLTRASWRLAADGGRDLPLGATFSGTEVFGATRAMDAGVDFRSLRNEFRPLIAQTPEDKVVRESRLAGALDGMVWVTSPTNAEAGLEGVSGTRDLPMAAVPSGRNATMVPAGSAFASIAVAAASGRVGAAAAGDQAELMGAVQGRDSYPAGTARSGWAPSTTAALASTGAADDALRMMRSGMLRSDAVPTMAAGVDPAVSGFRVTSTPMSARVALSASGVGAPVLGASDAQLFTAAGVSGVDAARGIGMTAESATAAVGGEPGSPTAGLARTSLAPRWLESVLRTPDARTGNGVARWVQEAVAQAGYGRLDDTRVMLALAEARTAEARERDVASDEVGSTAALPARRQAALFSALASVGRVTPAGEARGTSAASARRPSAANIARDAGGTGVPGAVGPRVAEARRGAADESGGSPVAEASEVRVRAMRDARQALLRSVMTARESRSIAAALGPSGSFASRPNAGQGGQGFAATALRLASQAGHGPSGMAVAGSDEPVLSRLVAALQSERADATPIAPRWDLDGGLMERIARLPGGERARVAHGLMSAGWTAPELELLNLRDVSSPQLSAVPEVSDSRLTDVIGATPERSASKSLDAARVGRMSQSLARVVSGNESLGGSVAESQSGSMASTAARVQAATWLPLLGGKTDKYFGALAPAQAASSKQMRLDAFDDAIGELVRMAEAEATKSDTPAASGAFKETLQRTLAVRNRIAAASASSDVKGGRVARAALSEASTSGRAAAPIAVSAGDAWRLGRGGDLGSAVDAALVERTSGRADIDLPSSRGVSVDRSVTAEPAVMRIPDAERTMVGLATDSTAETAQAGAVPPPTGLGRRVAEALALSAGGPAGARRLARAGIGAGRESSPALSTDKVGASSSAGRGAEMAGVAAPRKPGASRAAGLKAAELSEETIKHLPVGLSRVLAPEAMLSGLRSPELSRALKAVASRQAESGWDSVGVLTTLSDSGIDLGAARSSLSEGSRGGRASTGEQKRGDAAQASTQAQVMLRQAARLGGAAERALMEVLSGADAASAISRANLGTAQKAGLLSAVLRGTERAERSSLLERAGGSDFAFAWLSRVDGTRSGIDVGLGEARAEFGRTFGKKRDSALASSSPVEGASLVGPAAAPGEDRSGLRSVAAKVNQSATGGARPQHAASDAMRRTDWRFVETGSRASTAHADLGKLAAAIVGNSEAGKRAPMPLVAPAAKAVAQTALRKAGNESVGSAGGSGGGGGSPQSRGPGQPPKLSEKAIDALAVEMANRVARLMSLMKERIGAW